MDKIEKIEEYMAELKLLIKERTSKECEPWLVPQIESTAINRVMLLKIAKELLATSSLVQVSNGYNDQEKREAHPLLAHYDKLQRTLIAQYEALGLNYKTMPSKVKEDTRNGVSESDPMAEFYKGKK